MDGLRTSPAKSVSARWPGWKDMALSALDTSRVTAFGETAAAYSRRTPLQTSMPVSRTLFTVHPQQFSLTPCDFYPASRFDAREKSQGWRLDSGRRSVERAAPRRIHNRVADAAFVLHSGHHRDIVAVFLSEGPSSGCGSAVVGCVKEHCADSACYVRTEHHGYDFGRSKRWALLHRRF